MPPHFGRQDPHCYQSLSSSILFLRDLQCIKGKVYNVVLYMCKQVLYSVGYCSMLDILIDIIIILLLFLY